MTKNFDQFYEAIAARGVPHMLYLHQGGHGGSPPDEMLNRWFTRYLWGVQNGVESLPRAYVVRETYACPISTNVVGDQVNVVSIAVASSSTFQVGYTPSIPGVSPSRSVVAIPDATHLTIAGLSASLSSATVAGATTVFTNNISNMVPGHVVSIDSGASAESATIAATGAGGSTTIGLPTMAGDTMLKVSSVSGMNAGGALWIGSGASQETATIAAVGTSGATTVRLAAAAGDTTLFVQTRSGFSNGQAITIDSGAALEAAVVQSTGTNSSGGGQRLVLTAPLANAHAVGVQVSGSGVTLASPLTLAHAAGTAVTGNALMLTAPLAFDHASGTALYDPLSGVDVTDGARIYMCSTTYPTPYPEWPDPDSSSATFSFRPGAPGIGGLTLQAVDPAAGDETLIDDATLAESAVVNATSSANRLVYMSDPVTQQVRISGTMWVNLRAAFSKPKANVTVVLMSYPSGGGNGTIISRGWLDPENRDSYSVSEPMTPGTFYDLHFDMQPKDSVLDVGSQLGVVVLSSDHESTIRPAPGTEMTVDLAQSSISIPFVGGTAMVNASFPGDTMTSVAADNNPTAYGHAVTFTATVASSGMPTGTVQFSLDGAPVGGPVALDGAGQATGRTSALALGTHTVTADYAGDGTFNASSGSVDQVVKKRLGHGHRGDQRPQSLAPHAPGDLHGHRHPREPEQRHHPRGLHPVEGRRRGRGRAHRARCDGPGDHDHGRSGPRQPRHPGRVPGQSRLHRLDVPHLRAGRAQADAHGHRGGRSGEPHRLRHATDHPHRHLQQPHRPGRLAHPGRRALPDRRHQPRRTGGPAARRQRALHGDLEPARRLPCHPGPLPGQRRVRARQHGPAHPGDQPVGAFSPHVGATPPSRRHQGGPRPTRRGPPWPLATGCASREAPTASIRPLSAPPRMGHNQA